MVAVIRPAVPDDAGSIASIRVSGWRDTYAHLLSAEFLEAQSAEGSTPGIRRMIERATVRTAVYEVDGRIRGFATAQGSDETDAPRDWQLTLLYLLSSEHGRGGGQALLDSVVADRQAFLWVAEGNPRVRAFYRRNGFVEDGARKVAAEWENLVEIRMTR